MSRVPVAKLDSAETHSAACRWLLHSGIRSPGSAVASRGAICRAFDARRLVFLPPYPEITAYAVQFHLHRSQHAADEDFAAACESGGWLASVQADEKSPAPGAFPYSVEYGDPVGGYFTFDTAIAGNALLDLAAATGERHYRDAAERAGLWVLSQQKPDGSFSAGAGGARPASWAGSAGCLHGKLALFLGRLWRQSGVASYRSAALKLLGWLENLQRSDGGIVTAPGSGYVLAHAHCYAIEGLLAGATILDERRYVSGAVRGAGFLAHVQRSNGGVPRHCGHGVVRYLQECGARLPHIRMLAAPSDVGATAQAVRIWTWVQALDGGDFVRHIKRGLAWLAACQLRSADTRINGGFPAGIDPLKPWRRQEMLLYPWVAIFVDDASRLQQAVNVANDLY
jgi:hypothetical protein